MSPLMFWQSPQQEVKVLLLFPFRFFLSLFSWWSSDILYSVLYLCAQRLRVELEKRNFELAAVRQQMDLSKSMQHALLKVIIVAYCLLFWVNSSLYRHGFSRDSSLSHERTAARRRIA